MLRYLAFALALAAPQPFGAIYITSLPNAADVWVDGTYIGRTPVLLDGLRSGKHSITITKVGWRSAELEEPVSAGATSMASLQLDAVRPSAQRGTIVLHGVPQNARVRLDMGPWQSGRSVYSASAGTHRLSMLVPAGVSDRTIAVYPQQSTHVVFRMPAPPHSAVVAPLEAYIPRKDATVRNGRLVVRYGGHTVIGRIGDARFTIDQRDVVFDAPAGLVRGKLYLPLDLILAITARKTH